MTNQLCASGRQSIDVYGKIPELSAQCNASEREKGMKEKIRLRKINCRTQLCHSVRSTECANCIDFAK